MRGLGIAGAVTHYWAGTIRFTESGLPIVGPFEGLRNL